MQKRVLYLPKHLPKHAKYLAEWDGSESEPPWGESFLCLFHAQELALPVHSSILVQPPPTPGHLDVQDFLTLVLSHVLLFLQALLLLTVDLVACSPIY